MVIHVVYLFSSSSCEALDLAWSGDSVSAFGSVICFTSEVDINAANYLQDKFVEIIVAPSVNPEALNVFAQKKNMRILLCPPRKGIVQENYASLYFGWNFIAR